MQINLKDRFNSEQLKNVPTQMDKAIPKSPITKKRHEIIIKNILNRKSRL